MTKMKALLCAATAAAALAGPLAAHAGQTQGLAGAYYGSTNVASVAAAQAAISGLRPTASFVATEVCFPDCNGNASDDGASLSSFLGGNYTGLTTDVTTGLGSHVLELSGFLNISMAGLYNFLLESDDGSALFIDGVKVVDDDGNHGPANKTGTATLSLGAHSLDIIQFENGGGTELRAGFFNADTQAFTAFGGEAISTTSGATSGTPEPAAWALMLMGFGGLGVALRNRRRTAAAVA